MKNRNQLVYVEDMIASIDRIFNYINLVEDLNSFLKNQLIIDAVTRNYEIIGEAANKIDSTIKEKYPDIPWRQMYGLRNFAVHEYHIIDPIILWEIAENNLVENRNQLMQLLETESQK